MPPSPCPARRPQVGVYYYPWYDDRRWAEAPVASRPVLGRYRSTDPAVIDQHLDGIQEAGIDYVILELVSPHDWCYRTVYEATALVVSKLRARGIGWTFLIDTNPAPGPTSPVQDVVDVVGLVEGRGWTDGLVEGPAGLPLLMHYAPLPGTAVEVTRTYAGRFQMVYPIYLPHWREPDAAHDPVWAWAAGAREAGVTVHEFLTPLGYIAFWQGTDEVHNHAGFCAVEPGYDDTLLPREPRLAPVVPRRNGQHYRRRIDQALALQPEHLLIYSWNEFQEGSSIEPAEEYGSCYLAITRDRIAAGTAQRHRPSRRVSEGRWDRPASGAADG